MAAYAYKGEVEYSLPAPTASGRYYWTNTVYWRSDNANPFGSGEFNTHRLLCLNSVGEAVTVELTRVTSAFGTGTFAGEVAFPVPGHRPGSDTCQLLCAARLMSAAGGPRLWYKPLRGLLSPADVVGGLLSAESVAWLADNVVPRYGALNVVNYRDMPVGPLAISPIVHPWQMRHGTKRSARRVLAPLP